MIVGGVIVLGVGAFIMMLVFFPAHSDPSSATTARGVMNFVEITMPLRDVLGSEPSGPGNAGDDYENALKVYRANRDTFKGIKDRIELAQTGAVIGERERELIREVLDHCHRGAQKGKMSFSLEHGQPPLVTTHPTDYKALEWLMLFMGMYANHQLDLAIQGKNESLARNAETVAKDMLVLGWHAAGERAYPMTTVSGFQNQQGACTILESVYANFPGVAERADRVSLVREYGRAANMAASDAGRLWGICSGNPNPGDLFNVIENCPDPAWRVQATLWLGITRFRNEGHRGDRIYTQKTLDRLAREGTELEKRAVKAALGLTREEAYRGGTHDVPEP